MYHHTPNTTRRAASPPKLTNGALPTPHRPWSLSDWTSSDDRVRGGSSQSYLSLSDTNPPTTIIFHGTLDTHTLGGAGFASQRTLRSAPTHNLSAYDGLALTLATTDGKRYTLILKNDVLPRRPDGREQSSVSWEYDFAPAPSAVPTTLFIAWRDFRPTYRGRPVDALPLPVLDTARVASFTVMMRSFFGKQEGEFRLGITSIAAVKSKDKKKKKKETGTNEPYRDDVSDGTEETYMEKEMPVKRQGWTSWVFDGCGFL